MVLHRWLNRDRVTVVVPFIIGLITAVVLFSIHNPVYGPDGIVTYNTAIDPHIVITNSVLVFILASALVHFVYWLVDRCRKGVHK